MESIILAFTLIFSICHNFFSFTGCDFHKGPRPSVWCYF